LLAFARDYDIVTFSRPQGVICPSRGILSACREVERKLGDELPTLPVPLHAPDSDIFIDLAAVFATAYERGRYQKQIDYGGSNLPYRLAAFRG
jgi:hypothetical protein